MVEILRISPFVLNFILFSFPRSAYPCTPLARQPKISAQNPFAQSLRGASVFRRNRIKKAGALLKNSASAFSLCKIKAFKVFKVEILRISPFKLKLFVLFPLPLSYPHYKASIKALSKSRKTRSTLHPFLRYHKNSAPSFLKSKNFHISA
jgi:hypothetical protein